MKTKILEILVNFKLDKITLEEASKELFTLNTKIDFDDGNAGDVAVKHNITVGELGCRHCGTVSHGSLQENCEWCDTPWFDVTIPQKHL